MRGSEKVTAKSTTSSFSHLYGERRRREPFHGHDRQGVAAFLTQIFGRAVPNGVRNPRRKRWALNRFTATTVREWLSEGEKELGYWNGMDQSTRLIPVSRRTQRRPLSTTDPTDSVRSAPILQFSLLLAFMDTDLSEIVRQRPCGLVTDHTVLRTRKTLIRGSNYILLEYVKTNRLSGLPRHRIQWRRR